MGMVKNGGLSLFHGSFAAPPSIPSRRKLYLLAQAAPPSRTQRIMESIPVSGEVGGAGGAYSYNALKRLDGLWSSICNSSPVVQEPPQVVSKFPGLFQESERVERCTDMFDVIVCGGTLGIFVATALSSKGLRVGIVEKSILRGRDQEWNISRKELLELVEVGVLTEDDIDHITAASFNPIRRGRKPDGICLVVGSCCRGFTENSTSDVIYSSASVKRVGQSQAQYFWEAFPAGSGPLDRTTYMFTYLYPEPGCPLLEELLEDYWELMPKYQGVSLDDLEVLRVIYGIFPTYRDSPLPAAFDRILQKLGDPVLRPFLQDVIQFGPLVKTLGLVMLTRPLIIPSIFKQVGLPVLLDWSGHFMMLGYYTFLSSYLDPMIRPLVEKFPGKMKYEWKQKLEAWKYGAGLDYELSSSGGKSAAED
ncbi:UNVERIFIED_CONTAM: hypothetical protein Sradi_6454200 [Sesamum radiatum]|uniref:Lycopene beta-cyclase n=1 Tax=Sesamum radiatum TaxID=300843 RepID=A0AAW2K4S4_SESRA